MTTPTLAHWHDSNPWADSVCYIPVELAAALCEYSWGADETLAHWRQYGEKLDAYILPQPSGRHCLGVRYGAEGPEYISPHGNEARMALALIAWRAGFRQAKMTALDARLARRARRRA